MHISIKCHVSRLKRVDEGGLVEAIEVVWRKLASKTLAEAVSYLCNYGNYCRGLLFPTENIFVNFWGLTILYYQNVVPRILGQ